LGFVTGNYNGSYKISGPQLFLVTRPRLSMDKTIKFMSGDDLMRECVLIAWVSPMTGKQIAMHQWCYVEVFPTKVNWFLISVLDDNLLPDTSNCRWIFQEDNASFHVSARANQRKLENDINTLPWPELWYQHYRKCLENAQT
jgi:hypothetical protein